MTKQEIIKEAWMRFPIDCNFYNDLRSTWIEGALFALQNLPSNGL